MAVKASRQRLMIVLYVFIAIPVIVVLLFFLNPSFSAKATTYVQDIAGLHGSSGSMLPGAAGGDTTAAGMQVPESPADLQNESIEASSPPPEEEVDIPEQPAPSEQELPDSASPPPEQAANARLKSMSAALATPARSEALAAASSFASELKASATPSPSQGDASESQTSNGAEPSSSVWNEDKWWFQSDLEEYSLPNFDVAKLRHLTPHNYQGPGHETFATLYATRNGTNKDPYFLSALQIAYRVLWNPSSKSKHTFTVFVPPFISEEQRDYFRAAGAIVRELNLVPFEPDGQTIGRWKDMFTKLNLWTQLDFSRIVYLDSDVFPFNNTDSIFLDAPEQKCKLDMLEAQDKTYASEICNYVFSAAYQFEESWTINAGVMVLKPDQAMYEHLIRSMMKRKDFDTKMMEQSMLNTVYRQEGPFPVKLLDAKWNAAPDWEEKGKGNGFNYIHDKMWARLMGPGSWVLDDYKRTWAEMLALYESEDFVLMRTEDQERLLSNME